jgi:sigma-B regulation protein RsbU (phosphoserine phosphatase)
MAFGDSDTPGQNLDDILPMRSFWWLIESAPDGIVLVDSEGRILLFNTQAEELFGYQEDELLEKPVEVLIPERFREKHVWHRAAYAAEPRSRPMGLGLDLFGLRRDGSEFPVEISLSPVQTKKGLLVMAIIRDMTEHKRERLISQTLQKAMLSPLPEDLLGVQIASAYRSAHVGALVGGDFFDVFSVGPDLIALAIGDVSGKGVGAAVHTALAKYSLRAYAYEDPAPSSLMERLNSTLYRQLDPDMFITLLYGVLNVRERTFSFANAGHMPPLYVSSSNHQVSEMMLSGMPLGIVPEYRYEQFDMQLETGDRMLLYSDGVTEARDGSELYGVDNLMQFLHHRGLEPPSDFVAHLTRTLMEWSGERLRDDTAMLMLAVD